MIIAYLLDDWHTLLSGCTDTGRAHMHEFEICGAAERRGLYDIEGWDIRWLEGWTPSSLQKPCDETNTWRAAPPGAV